MWTIIKFKKQNLGLFKDDLKKNWRKCKNLSA